MPPLGAGISPRPAGSLPSGDRGRRRRGSEHAVLRDVQHDFNPFRHVHGHFRVRTFKQNAEHGVRDATDADAIVDDSRYVMLVDRSTSTNRPTGCGFSIFSVQN